MASLSLGPAESRPPVDESALPAQAQLVNGVLVPVPREIFRVLDTFHDSNWKAVLRPDLSNLQPAGTSARIALSLGLVVGEGFIAMAAEDSAEMQDLGRAALKLARALGVEKSMLRREKSIIDHANKKEWAAVRREWSEANADLKKAMVEIKSGPLSQLVSLGGWLRGMEALSALVSQHYSAGDAQLLYQPALLAYFDRHLAEMRSKFKTDPTVVEMEKGAIRLHPIIGGEHGSSLSEPDVKKIRTISTDLVKFITTEPGQS